MYVDPAAVAEQDSLRTRRAFIGLLSTLAGVEQTYTSDDGAAVNPPYQYQVIGPQGVAVQGAPVSTAQGVNLGGITIPPAVLLLGVVALAAYALSK